MIKRFRESILFVVLFVITYQTMAEEFPKGCLVEGNPAVDSSSHLFIRGKDEHLYEWQQNSKEDGTEFWQVYQLPSIGEQDIKSDPIIGLASYDVKVDETDETGNVILDENGNPRKIEKNAGGIRQVFARGQGGHLLEWRRPLSGPLEANDWQRHDLTEENGYLIAGTPSKTSNSGELPYFYTDGILQRFFTTSTPDDHLLRWLLPKLVLENESSKDDRVWSVVDLTTTDDTTQNSAGDISIDYLNNNIFTRDPLGHLIVGWPFLPQEEKIDLTTVIGGQTIIGNPIGYGTFAQTVTGSDIYQFFLHVFARDSNGHLYEWRHVWEGELRSQLWRKALNTDWQLSNLTEKVGGNVAGNIAVYITAEQKEKDVVTNFLNVLARNSDDHLLKWSKEHSTFTQENEEWIFRMEEGDCCWEFEDLTDLSGYLIKGDPVINTDFSRMSYDIYSKTEYIFVKGENNHLLRWTRQWQEETREDENGAWTAIIEPGLDDWQVTDLTRRCENASETLEQVEDSRKIADPWDRSSIE